jgi:hypothetical protein
MYSIRSRTAIDIFPGTYTRTPEKFGFRRHIAAPIDRRPVGARLLKRQQLFAFRFCSVFPAQALVVFARFLSKSDFSCSLSNAFTTLPRATRRARARCWRDNAARF